MNELYCEMHAHGYNYLGTADIRTVKLSSTVTLDSHDCGTSTSNTVSVAER